MLFFFGYIKFFTFWKLCVFIIDINFYHISSIFKFKIFRAISNSLHFKMFSLISLSIIIFFNINIMN